MGASGLTERLHGALPRPLTAHVCDRMWLATARMKVHAAVLIERSAGA